jgi:hypothetical protein
MASDLELLEGYLRVTAGGEEDNIPVVIAHPSDRQRWSGRPRCTVGGDGSKNCSMRMESMHQEKMGIVGQGEKQRQQAAWANKKNQNTI